jgi:hypothetical protein
MEIQNTGENYLFRGEIASIALEEEDLCITFKWLAKMNDNHEWIKDDGLIWKGNVQIGGCLSDIGNGRLSVTLIYHGENSVLFPREQDGLDPKTVQGLELIEEVSN